MNTIINKGLFVIIFSGLLFIAGCSSLKPIPYAFAEDERNSASISFKHGANPGTSLVSFKGSGLPLPEEKTTWDPLLFPSGEPLDITVHASYIDNRNGWTYNPNLLVMLLSNVIADAVTSEMRLSRAVDMDVVFSCPPLEAGKNYSLSFDKKDGVPGRNILVLTDTETRKIVHQQEFGILVYPEPEFDKPFAYVIDAFKADGDYEDNVVMHNNTTDRNITFRIYAHDPITKEWIVLGIGSLKGAGDSESIDADVTGNDIDYYRYFAIESVDGKNYKYEFYKRRDDLNIRILDY